MDASFTTNNSRTIDCRQLINCENSINELPLEQHGKQNFRQLLRSLRQDETNDCGPLVASSEDQINVTDDEGFIVIHRNKKNRKSKNVQYEEENVNTEVTRNISAQSQLENLHGDDDVFKFDTSAQNTETENPSQLSHRISSEEEELKTCEKTQTPDDTKKKRTWLSTPPNRSRRTFDSSECPICFTPFLNDKIILEECGHCFHSECIRLWMKQKNTCPFCAGYSLLPEEFPRLT